MQQNISLDIKGMTCASCVNRIEKVLKKDSGVLSASVNLATEKAKIEYDDAHLDSTKLISLVAKAGYQASLSENKKPVDKKYLLKKEKLLIILSSLLSL